VYFSYYFVSTSQQSDEIVDEIVVCQNNNYSALDSRTLRSDNVPGLLVFTNHIKISDSKSDIKRRTMACVEI